jgi:type I restriction enzyme S subunit
MSKWIESEISKIGSVVSGGTPSTSVSKYWNGDILFVTPYDLSRNRVAFIEATERKISREGLENSSANLLPVGSIILSSRAPIGYIAIAKKEFTTNQGCKSIIPNSDFDSLYFYYCFQFYVERIKKYGEGTTFAEISKGDLELIKFPHPKDKTEQRQIATILSTADAVIEKTQAAIAKYRAIKQGMLQDVFTRGIDTATGKLRPSHQDAPHLYKESKLGWIPKEWDEKSLEGLTTQIGDGIHTTPKYSKNTNFYFINGNNLVDGEIEIGSAQCVTEEEYKKHFKDLNSRTILYSINGTIGNIAIYKNEKVILGKSACYITCKSSVNLDYLFFILQTFSIQRFYELEMTGSTIKNLSLASVRNTPIAIPKDDKEQEIIAQRIRIINNKLQTEQTFLDKQLQIKAGLMNDLLSGKKKVTFKEKEMV